MQYFAAVTIESAKDRMNFPRLPWLWGCISQDSAGEQSEWAAYVCRERERDFKGLPYTIVKTWQVQNPRWKLEAGGLERSSSPKMVCWQNSFSPRELSLFLLRPSTDWMWPTHILKVICFTHSLLIWMLISFASWIMFDQISEYHGLTKLTPN